MTNVIVWNCCNESSLQSDISAAAVMLSIAEIRDLTKVKKRISKERFSQPTGESIPEQNIQPSKDADVSALPLSHQESKSGMHVDSAHPLNPSTHINTQHYGKISSTNYQSSTVYYSQGFLSFSRPVLLG